MATPGYTFVSISTPKPGKLEDLIAISRRPGELMEGKVPGMIARQVSVDRERNTVIVWTTFENKSDLYDYLATAEGQGDHEGDVDMNEIIETFEMYDMEPISSGKL